MYDWAGNGFPVGKKEKRRVGRPKNAELEIRLQKQVVCFYKNGWSIRQLAFVYVVTTREIRVCLEQANIEFRRRGRADRLKERMIEIR